MQFNERKLCIIRVKIIRTSGFNAPYSYFMALNAQSLLLNLVRGIIRGGELCTDCPLFE